MPFETPIRRGHGYLKLLVLLCVLAVSLSGFVQAVHVHSESSKVPRHDCTLCSVAHAGVIASPAYRVVPVFDHSVLAVSRRVSSRASGFVSTLRIRPPPSPQV